MAAGRVLLAVVGCAALGGCAPKLQVYPMLHGWCTTQPEIVQIVMETPAGETLLPAEYGRYYPERAMRLGKSGSGKVSCAVGPSHRATSCTLLDEWPTDFGFGEAATKVPKVVELPTGSQNIVVRIDFHLIRSRFSNCH